MSDTFRFATVDSESICPVLVAHHMSASSGSVLLWVCGRVPQRHGKEFSNELNTEPWREAAQEMMVGPSGSAFRSRSQTSPSCCGQKAVVVNVGSKVPGKTWGRWVSGSRAEANPRRRVDNHTRRQNQRRSTSLGSVRREPDDRAGGDRPDTGCCAELWEPALGCQGRSTSGAHREARVPKPRAESDRPIVVRKAL